MSEGLESALELEQVITQVFRRLGKEITQSLDVGLSPAQFLVLRMLREKGRASVSEVAGWLGVTRSAVTSLADRLRDAGLIDRIRDADDRRVVWLALTPTGGERLQGMQGRRLVFLRERLSRLTADEQRQLAQLLAKLGLDGGQE